MKKFGKTLLWEAILTIWLCGACVHEEVVCIKENPLFTEYIVEHSNNHLAFPTITEAENGAKILIAYREAKTHISFDGCIVQKESYDKGKTWINKRVIYQPESSHADARDPQFLRLPDGRLICRFFERASEGESVLKFIQSDDGGVSYTPLSSISSHKKSDSYTAARGNMLLQDGVIYTSVYNRWHHSWLMKSEDEGASWEFVSWISHPDGNECAINQGLTESSICYEDNIMYLLARNSEPPQRIVKKVSKDRGATWEEWSELDISGHAPSLTPYKDSYILTYRNIDIERNENADIQFDCVLFGKGKLLATPFPIFRSKRIDVGYGDALVLGDSFLVCCYVPHVILCFEVPGSIFEMETRDIVSYRY